MNYLPFERVTYKSHLKQEELVKKLSDATQHKNPSNFKSPVGNHLKPYQGLVTAETFTILRNINYRNSFRPITYGTFHKSLTDTVIYTKMKLHPFVMIFLIIWLSAALFGSLMILITLFESSEYNLSFFIPFGMLIFAYIMTTIAFSVETKRTKEDLKILLEAEIIVS